MLLKAIMTPFCLLFLCTIPHTYLKVDTFVWNTVTMNVKLWNIPPSFFLFRLRVAHFLFA
jgi:hypothetical protein